MSAQSLQRRRDARVLVGLFHLVALGQHDRIGDGRGVEQLHRDFIAVFQAVAAVDQDEGAQQRRAAAQIVARERAPRGGFVLRDRRVAVARHVDQRDPIAQVEEYQLLRPPRRIGGSGQRSAPGQRVDERGLADVGAAGEGDFRRVRSAAVRRIWRRRSRIRTAPRTACAPARSRRLRRHLRPPRRSLRRHGRRSFAGTASADCPNSSIFTPARFMISDCWSIPSACCSRSSRSPARPGTCRA